ncbi:hypothetical protein [Pseudovibrio sp. POLY-S9]|uniref:hypothetical protein n=1 Tax=Pseudovibrio sp. POLY-S9 TaxID=1576596 RepID=UPI00070F2A02|nr:hypothetical protein [Pseudovibrio sp. POLY-S9]
MRLKNFGLYYFAVMNAEGGSGSGGEGDPPGGAGDPPGGAGDPPGGAGDPPGGAGDPPGGAGDPPGGADPLEGLPDNLRGESDADTIKNLADAMQGYHKRDSDNGVPDEVTAYSQFGEGVPDNIRDSLGELAEDPVFQRAAEKAKDLGIGVSAMQGLTTALFEAAADAGMLEPPIDAEAERQALVPETAAHLPAAEQKQAIELRMNENFAFVDQMVARDSGGLEKDTAEFAKTMLGDSAHGHKFIEFMRSLTAGGSGPTDNPGQGGAGLSAEELQRRAALPENTPNHREFKKSSYDSLMADFQKFHGEK